MLATIQPVAIGDVHVANSINRCIQLTPGDTLVKIAVKYRYGWQVEANCCVTQALVAGLYAILHFTPKKKQFAFGTRGRAIKCAEMHSDSN
jgi:hypothetical protein